MATYTKFKDDIINLFNSVWFMLPIVIVSIFSYGYILLNPTISVDDTAIDFYYKNAGFLSQGRFGPIIFNKLFGVFNSPSTLPPIFSVMLLIISAIIWCSLFKTFSENKINKFSFVIFACFYISYPLITELFNYDGGIFNLSIGLVFVQIILIFIDTNFEQISKKSLIISSLLLCIALSFYESLASVYLVGVFIILILKLIYSSDVNDKNLKFIRSRLWKFLLPLEISVILYFLIYILLNLLFDLPIDYSDKSIYWTEGLFVTIKGLIKSMFFSYGINSLAYIPITYLLIALILQVYCAISYFYKSKNFSVFYLILGIIISLFSMSILRGYAAPYRTCTTFGLFISFTFMIIVDILKRYECKKVTKYSIITFFLILLIWQINDINKWFYVENLRYEEEVNVARVIGNEILKQVNFDKPVVFIGRYNLSDNIKQYIYVPNDHIIGKLLRLNESGKYLYKFTETNILSFLSWGNGCYFYENRPSETHEFFKTLGYNLTPDNKYIYNEVKDMVNQIPSWPRQGYIHETDDYVIVNFGG